MRMRRVIKMGEKYTQPSTGVRQLSKKIITALKASQWTLGDHLILAPRARPVSSEKAAIIADGLLQLLPELQYEDREQVHKICRMVLYGIAARKPEKPVNRPKMPKQQKTAPQVIAVAYKPVKRSFHYPRDLTAPE